MRQTQLAISPCVLLKFVCRAVRLQPDEDSHFLYVPESGINLMKAADIKIPDKTIEMTRVLRQQCAESIAEIVARLVRYECKVSGHLQVSPRGEREK